MLKTAENQKGFQPFIFYLYVVCFLILKIILKIPLKNFGLLNNTTFIKCTPYLYLQQGKQSIITQIPKTPIKILGGQKQLIKRPIAKVIAKTPLLNPFLRRIRYSPFFMPSIHYIEIIKKGYFILLSHDLRSFISSKSRKYDSWRVGSTKPFFTASKTAQPFSFVWEQEANLQPLK